MLTAAPSGIRSIDDAEFERPDDAQIVVPRTTRVELMGSHLRAEGSVDLGSFNRLSDYVNLLSGFFTIQDVVLLSRIGQPTRLSFDRLRVRLDDIGLIAQKAPDELVPSEDHVVTKAPRRLVVTTADHIVYGLAFLHPQASLTAFIDANEPHFVPMTNVRVRWLADRRLAGRYPFALLQRSHIIGVATDGWDGPNGADGRPAGTLSGGLAADLGW